MYKLILKRSARKELDNLPDSDFLKIDKALFSLQNNPRPFPQAKKLKGENKLRLRVGDYRVVYSVEDEGRKIVIYRVRHRKNVYR